MKRILLIDMDEHFLELARLGLEERLGLEIVTLVSAEEAINLLKKEISFDLVISDYQEETLLFLVSEKSVVPFFYFTDEHRIEIPFTPTMFVGVFRRRQFKELCESVIHLMKRKE